MRRMLPGLMALGLALAACEKKGEEAKPVGELEFSVVPDTLKVSTEPGDYTVSVTGKETGGAAVTMDSVVVVVTYTDGSPVMLAGQNLTESQLTWRAGSPEEGGPMAGMLEEFWTFEAGETKTFALPVKVGFEPSPPEGFAGLYFNVLYFQAATAAGQPGFKVTLTYEAADENGNPVVGTIVLYIQVQT
ncbi:MAG: hypothetical protein DRP95_07240 [Candidatus Latescibacterota bacterium]|nr:MAG: hypothetical protein DRP95_07240 [Candidatus Latescibacterota bacterium]